LPVSNVNFPLFLQIQACLGRKWAVIPLIGGAHPERGKRPVLRWQPYTRRLPSPDEIRGWFAGQGRTAYGVVCGSVSRLVVLDLDDPALAARFAQAFPSLLDTLVVRSGLRGTPHIYWRVDFPVRTCSFAGGDLKAEGSYVVGPGSRIASGCWQVLSDRPVRSISREELDRVLDFLVPAPSRPVEVRQLRQSTSDYPALYRFYVERLQARNNALFAVTCLVRDNGCNEAQAVRMLADLHARQPSPVDGRLEPFQRRYAEAVATIRSAYSRPARSRSVQRDRSAAYLPNSVREVLLSRPDGAAIARTIEAAQLKGITPSDAVTEPLLCRLLHGIVSRETIRKALAACYADGSLIFRPPDHPPALADIPNGIMRQKNAFLSGGQKQTTVRSYTLPDPATMCQRLGVQARGSDPITLEDVSSSRRYRQALHRALLRRRPGVYSQAMLGARLGVSSRSIRRYHRELDVHSQPTYTESPVLWATIEQIPQAAELERFGICTGGQFLIDDSGKRWPLRREIAAGLLRQGRRVSYMRQGCNYYWCGDLPVQHTIEPDAGVTAQSHPCGLFDVAAPSESRIPQTMSATPQPAQDRPDFAREGGSVPRTSPMHPATPQKAGKRRFRQPLLDMAAERAACRVYKHVPDISLPNARRLVETYGPETVDTALRKFRWLKDAGKVERPAGLMITLARVSWHARQRQTGPGMAGPRFAAEPRRKSRADAYVHPKADPLWKSVAYRDWRAEFFGLDDPLLEATLEEISF
jgi:hypothetical protein